MKKFFSILICSFLTFSLFACTKKNSSTKCKIGVSMPNLALERWKRDGTNVKTVLENSGYNVDLQYGEGNVNIQVNQIENMISKNCKFLIIAPIDSKSLTNILKKAKEQDVKIIAYDRLITDTKDVDYYVTFDNIKVGEIQGKYIENALNLKNSDKSFNIEFFMGDQADENARTFYRGVINILKPYIDSGKLKVPSEQIDFEKVATPGWETIKAQQRMDNIYTSKYSDGTKLDAVVATSDCLALGVINSLTQVYKDQGMSFPIITGQDCDKANVNHIIKGKQSFSILKDTRKLAEGSLNIVDSIYEQKPLEINKTYNNGIKEIATYTYEPVVVNKENYKELLINSKFYKEEDFKNN